MSEINGHAFTARETGIVHELRIPVFVAATGDTIDKNITLSAIIDTGATNCAITSKAAQKIGALPIGMIDVSGVHGVDNVQLYAIDMLLPSDIFLQDVQACDMDNSVACDVLIGMDVLVRGDFCLTNFQGKTTFSFRIPSLEVVDYTVKAPHGYHWTKNKVGRNAPCPCGSGKKYKKCCGKNRSHSRPPSPEGFFYFECQDLSLQGCPVFLCVVATIKKKANFGVPVVLHTLNYAFAFCHADNGAWVKLIVKRYAASFCHPSLSHTDRDVRLATEIGACEETCALFQSQMV